MKQWSAALSWWCGRIQSVVLMPWCAGALSEAQVALMALIDALWPAHNQPDDCNLVRWFVCHFSLAANANASMLYLL